MGKRFRGARHGRRSVDDPQRALGSGSEQPAAFGVEEVKAWRGEPLRGWLNGSAAVVSFTAFLLLASVSARGTRVRAPLPRGGPGRRAVPKVVVGWCSVPTTRTPAGRNDGTPRTRLVTRFSRCRGRDSNPHAPEGTPAFKAGASHPFRHPGGAECTTTSRAGAGSGRSAQARGTGVSGRTSRPRFHGRSCTSRGSLSAYRRRLPTPRARTCRPGGRAGP
jgi:hypothetical protein